MSFVDPVSIQSYLMSWLNESATDSEQLHLLFPQCDGNQSSLTCHKFGLNLLLNMLFNVKVKVKRYIALPDKSSQSYEVSLAIWDHTVLPDT